MNYISSLVPIVDAGLEPKENEGTRCCLLSVECRNKFLLFFSDSLFLAKNVTSVRILTFFRAWSRSNRIEGRAVAARPSIVAPNYKATANI